MTSALRLLGLRRSALAFFASFTSFLPCILSADTISVVVSRQSSDARPVDVVSLPWSELAKALPQARPEKLIVRDAKGASLTYQFTNFRPDDRRGLYDDLLFPCQFAAGETSKTFSIETTDTAVIPFAPLVFARHVPERYDDFAWENDKVAHRIYGPGLATVIAGHSRMVSSGIDIWAKKVSYPIVDRWYLRGHDNYHIYNGEGLDFYSVGTTRGAGGTGVWLGDRLHPSRNWAGVKVLANGPLRAVFEVSYAEWQPGPSLWVSEVKRFTVDAGRNVDRIEATYTISGATEATIAIGLGKNPKAPGPSANDVKAGWLSLWQTYAHADEGSLGTGVVVDTKHPVTVVEDEMNHLLLTRIKSGTTIRFWAGAGWSHAGEFPDAAAWQAYLARVAAAEKDPLQVRVESKP